MVLGCAGFQARAPQGLTTGELSQGKQDLRLSPLRQLGAQRGCVTCQRSHSRCALEGRRGPGLHDPHLVHGAVRYLPPPHTSQPSLPPRVRNNLCVVGEAGAGNLSLLLASWLALAS